MAGTVIAFNFPRTNVAFGIDSPLTSLTVPITVAVRGADGLLNAGQG
jgi:hypothetical protein